MYMKTKHLLTLIFMACSIVMSRAQTEIRTELQATGASGDHNPLWLNANKYGLSSLDEGNGYMRAGIFHSMEADSARHWAYAYGADVAVAAGFTSTLVVQQAYGELRWLKGLLTVGSKQQPMELKNQELSSGSQTLGINARPIPSVRLALPDYWDIPGLSGWLGLKGHIAYGRQTDDRWQKDFTDKTSKYTVNTRLHTKAGYLRIGPADKPLTLELGLEMGCQYGGTSYTDARGEGYELLENKAGLAGMWHAFIPNGYEANEKEMVYKNVDGNHLGSMVGRLNLDYPSWGVSLYVDHFFEDHSQIFFFSNNGYGKDDEWNDKVENKYFVYDVRDAMWGLELRLKRLSWLNTVVAEYLYTKYQSGPIYHDHTKHMSDQIAGRDNYYNHSVFAGWQHWGQVIGNPLYRSPLYNSDGTIMVKDNRFWAIHLGIAGDPLPGLHYRLLYTWQRGFGTYETPLSSPQRNTSMLAEVEYWAAEQSRLKGWGLRGALGIDRGQLLGDNIGLQLTVARRFSLAH